MAGLGSLVDAVQVRTALGSFTLDLSEPSSSTGGPGLLELLQPAVTVVVGGQPVNVAPWGEPPAGGELLSVGALLLLVGALVGVGYLLGKAR